MMALLEFSTGSVVNWSVRFIMEVGISPLITYDAHIVDGLQMVASSYRLLR